MEYRMKKIIFAIASLLLFTATLVFGVKIMKEQIDNRIDFDTDIPSSQVTPEGLVRVYLNADEHCTVIGENPVYVKEGKTAVFKLVFNENYALDKTNANYKNGSLYVVNCASDTSVYVTSRMMNDYFLFDYEPPLASDGAIAVSNAPGKYIASKVITITAKPNTGSTFTGWSVGGTVLDGGTMVSHSLSYSFKLSGDIKLYPNFLKEGYSFIKYNLNGGVLAADGTTDEIITQFNTSVKPCPNLMPDNGTIVRDGYTLLEFTTNPDGGGTAINPGGLADIPDTGVLEVWAQWSKWTDASSFEYIEADDRITITKFLKDEPVVSIPEYINGKPVTEIRQNAFDSKSFHTLIIPKSVKTVEASAFKNCLSFDTLYIFDTFTSIPDNAFTNCKKFSNLRLNAGRNPSYSKNAESIATRLGYIMTRENYSDKPILLLVGGSSALFGFDSELLEELLNYEYFVLNCGTNAGGCGMLYIEALSAFMREGDIIMNVPEFGNVQFGDCNLYWRAFRATESCYNIYRYVDFSRYSLFFSAMSEFNSSADARANLSEVSYEIKNTSLTAFHCDIASTRLYQNRVFGAISLNASMITDARINNFNTTIAIVNGRGIKYYLGSPPVYAYGLKATESDIYSFLDRMAKNVNAPYISNPIDYKYEKELYYDSAYHLTTEGAILRTRQLAKDILSQFKKESK